VCGQRWGGGGGIRLRVGKGGGGGKGGVDSESGKHPS
jgi:hypothetical protein